ncbi:MAG: hypothetical protein WCW53_01675 [Syntrophales bacterium]|jgi:hypothetical protein
MMIPSTGGSSIANGQKGIRYNGGFGFQFGHFEEEVFGEDRVCTAGIPRLLGVIVQQRGLR